MAKKKNLLEVVATAVGHYGKMRSVGEPFVLRREEDRSERWMTDADSDQGKELRAAYERTHGPVVTVALVDDDTVNEELAQSRGNNAAKDREIARLNEELATAGNRIAELEAALQGHGEPNAGDAGVDPTGGDDEGDDSEDRRRTDDKSSNEDSKPRARRRRTS